jgi:aminopeptidase YwaD
MRPLTEIERRIVRHLERLCVEIGPRPNGSAGNHQAADYVEEVFLEAGLKTERQEYDCPAWECQETRLELNGEELEAVANAFSPACDVIAPVAALRTLPELEAADLAGRIGVLHGDLTGDTLGCKAWFLTSDRDRRIVQVLEEKGPAALITVQPKPGAYDRLIEDWEFHIPSATVGGRAGLAILREPLAQLRLKIDSRQWPSHTCNVVARKPGRRPERIVLCAHYDTKIDTPGACDNASGVAVLLALAEALATREFAYGLEWIAFTGEEYLPTGDDEYVRRQGNEFGQIVAAINTDLAGALPGANSITTISRSDAFHEQMLALTASYPDIVWVAPWPESNHSTFSFRGVPSIAIGSVGAEPLQHTRSDTIERVDPAGLQRAVALIAEIVESLQSRSLEWGRPMGD